MIQETRHEARQRLIAYAVVGLLAGLLFVSATHTRTANERALDSEAMVGGLQDRLARSEALVNQLTTEHDLLLKQRITLLDEVDRLAVIPSLDPPILHPSVIVHPCEERDTPVFPRDSQFHGAEHGR